MKRVFTIAIGLCLISSRCLSAETADQAIARATAAVEAATPRAQADPSHPVFHVASPAQWMNDPNGPIFYKGWYHLFYQLNPYSDGDGPKHWGHVRSRDLVKWEHLPIAVAPSNDLGEEAIWSGCCTVDCHGQPVIFYTSIGLGKSAFDQAAQWMALGDDDLIHWRKSPANPVLSDAVNEGTKIYDWRDPFVFRDGKRTLLVTGGHLAREGHAAVSIYEAQNAELTQWKFRGPMFEHPDAGAPTIECPNFFKLGKEWVLFVSPYNHVEYFIGDFNADTCRFTAHSHGLVDYGTFYAPNTMQLPDDRRLVWGWVNGFPGGHGWNGCLSLPRQLSISSDEKLIQTPAPQLTKLRGERMAWLHIHPGPTGQEFKLPATNTLEIEIEARLQPGGHLPLELRSSSLPVKINYDGSHLAVIDSGIPLKPADDGKLTLHIFVDRSVLEIFANGTVWTRVIPTMGDNPSLIVRTDGDKTQVSEIQAWPVKSIW